MSIIPREKPPKQPVTELCQDLSILIERRLEQESLTDDDYVKACQFFHSWFSPEQVSFRNIHVSRWTRRPTPVPKPSLVEAEEE